MIFLFVLHFTSPLIDLEAGAWHIGSLRARRNDDLKNSHKSIEFLGSISIPIRFFFRFFSSLDFTLCEKSREKVSGSCGRQVNSAKVGRKVFQLISLRWVGMKKNVDYFSSSSLISNFPNVDEIGIIA